MQESLIGAVGVYPIRKHVAPATAPVDCESFIDGETLKVSISGL